eukprot:2816355-Pleurochrysis_carterae.AAC.4
MLEDLFNADSFVGSSILEHGGVVRTVAPQLAKAPRAPAQPRSGGSVALIRVEAGWQTRLLMNSALGSEPSKRQPPCGGFPRSLVEEHDERQYSFTLEHASTRLYIQSSSSKVKALHWLLTSQSTGMKS